MEIGVEIYKQDERIMQQEKEKNQVEMEWSNKKWKY
jgi:hypothetical protein